MEYSEVDLLVLRSIDKITTQQTIAQEIGFSVGKVNFVLKALIAKGLVKAENFANNQNKKQYKYLLTEKGIKEKINLTEKFIEQKKKEYDMLQADLQMHKANGEYAKAKGSI
ncbi:MarR family EPS-associated transcriptional regulator [Sulfurimonas paralvinellae]|uniref:MarR family EPS-associated transcriptional regulator n=1 Tax=Sulfurimonas paralvinellae TaxID=317658 RepID=A0A7M1B8C2_9BACT|nr:MarR family EPS-associated transcriptional regulator [Sulfurimonas paralvinellae]QOP45851.1 MarR family EPS-associated transcriptional regulator [Sulfurimonas paralvinellae]